MATLSESPSNTEHGSRTICWLCASLLLSILASWVAYQQIDRPLTGIDDANIFLTYGQHLAEGDGFVYYRGGERVEGFTSLLWTLLCGLCLLLSKQPEPLLLGINIGLLSSTIFLLIRYLQGPGSPAELRASKTSHYGFALIVWGWCLLNPKFVIWTTLTLMDIGLWCFALTCGSIAFAKAASSQKPLSRGTSWSLCGYLALALLTRPEAMLIGLVWLSGLLLGRHQSQRALPGTEGSSGRGAIRAALRESCIPVIAYLVLLGSLTGFRLLYFGYPLPNTFYAKVSPNLLYNLKLGLGYLRGFFLDQLWASIACVVLGLRTCRFIARSFGWLKLPSSSAQAERLLQGDMIALSALAAIAAPVLTGGDHFALYRFFQPAWPLLLVAGIFPLLSKITTRWSTQPRWLAGLVLSLLLSSFYCCQRPWWNGIETDIQVEFDFARSGRELGTELNAFFPGEQKPALGIITTGGIGYTYQGPLIDLMGLNSVRMGHSPGERRGNKNHAAFHQEVFFQLSPDLVDPRFVDQNAVPKNHQDLIPPSGGFWEGALQQIHHSRKFQATYRPAIITCREQEEATGRQIAVWCKPAVIRQLKERNIAVEVLPTAQQ